ncbi:hypothetical protein RCIP0012_00099 [Klebsiella phage RCIP0012]|uniref:Uncharacterized protein n=1 Tax=Klebsiella phage May TaxID=2054272 RepID=A0A2H5BP19_9CAUD|nr:hypothetical protein HOS53_gp088 [Klebsiella phage May]AUG88072.1 hypothetical protein CPT_May_158 [Klebsiella phage May]UJD04838.1 hypothetical protein PWKp5_00095 [Klebsiella phage PWKp5]CAK6598111.1 unknown function [Klebsiella phage vB_Ko_K5lambda5]
MVDYWLLANIITFALLMATAFVWVKAMLTFLSSLAMQISYYSVTPHEDQNIRAAQQSEYLSKYVHLRERSVTIVLFSTMLFAVILFVRYVMEAIHAVL